ncbi:hypothetical protein [Flavobacterium ginsengiterrae]|uniref:Uncharacterized protein n=1 Tax=Flavobacterium ginsengiterrae TaxID=871695 RepID=A0ABP7G647_9FLAO
MSRANNSHRVRSNSNTGNLEPVLISIICYSKYNSESGEESKKDFRSSLSGKPAVKDVVHENNNGRQKQENNDNQKSRGGKESKTDRRPADTKERS